MGLEDSTEKVLDNLQFIERKTQYGDLVIYQVLDKFFSPKIEISDSISLVYPQKVNMKVWPYLTSQENYFVSPTQGHTLDESIRSSTSESLIFPENSFSYPEASDSSIENTIADSKALVTYMEQNPLAAWAINLSKLSHIFTLVIGPGLLFGIYYYIRKSYITNYQGIIESFSVTLLVILLIDFINDLAHLLGFMAR